jgi:hypothetical protein
MTVWCGLRHAALGQLEHWNRGLKSHSGHVTFWLENLKEEDHPEDLGVDGKIVLEWILVKEGRKV